MDAETISLIEDLTEYVISLKFQHEAAHGPRDKMRERNATQADEIDADLARAAEWLKKNREPNAPAGG